MTDPLQVDADALRATAAPLTEVSSAIEKVRSSVVPDGSAPWGDDATGRAFAEGDQGWLAQVAGLLDILAQQSKFLAAFAAQVTDAANSYQRQDLG